MTQSSHSSPRILAIHPTQPGPSRGLSRLIGALSAQGAVIETCGLGSSNAILGASTTSTFAEIRAGVHALAESVGAALSGDASPLQTSIEQTLRNVEGEVDAVLVDDAALGVQALGAVAIRWPEALRIAVGGDFDSAQLWGKSLIDSLITPHPTLGAELAPIREGRARLYAGGPNVPLDGPQKRLGEDKANVVMSFHRLSASDVDPLLFQLSLTDPERYHLLFLPSGRASVDDLVRSRAAGYGLSGKRPRPGSDPEPWVRGADLLVGHPGSQEAAVAVSAQVPQVIFSPNQELEGGDAFLVHHGLALHAPSALTLAVQVDAALPGGAAHGALSEALERLETDGVAGVAGCVLRSIREGRVAQREGAEDQSVRDDDLEDIGGPTRPRSPRTLDARARRAYLKEIIVQQQELKRQIDRARSGVDTWGNRRRLAQRAGDARLEREAAMRVEGIERVLRRLVSSESDAQALRERFASASPLSESDCEAAERLMSPQASATIDKLSRAAERGAFERMEIEDALRELKRRMGHED